MPIDFGKIEGLKPTERIIDPVALFHTLKVSDPAIKDLHLAQGDALRQWNSERSQADVAIVLNTGAGKTLVGLLAAQSLVNETRGQVLYACSSIQLVEQTAAKARGYGLKTATYFLRHFNNEELYYGGVAPCITTYQALFNGKSRFFKDDISAVVFDDAHTAEHLLRGHFTLSIDRDSFPDLYSTVCGLFRGYYARIGKDAGYIETLNGQDRSAYWFVPPFAVQEEYGELIRSLLDSGLGDNTDTMFAWEHNKNHIDLCALLMSAQEVVFTPPVVPVGSMSYFRKDVRRLYLSATLTAKDGFIRTFGRSPDRIIAPTTKAGECERLIVVPSLSVQCTDEVQTAKQIVAGQKALILVPAHSRKRKWSDISTANLGDDVTKQVETFKAMNPPTTLVLTARYDGIDLPGDTCRVMVIDDLPSGLGLLERFLWEKLGLVKILRSTIASRVIQSFGRISRGMSDHGVVIVTGDKLVNWLLVPKNREELPRFLSRQLELGIHLSRQVQASELAGLAGQCLDRDEGWISYYQRHMDELQDDVNVAGDEETIALARVESDFGHRLWSRDYVGAAKRLELALDAAFKVSAGAGAWHALWLGYSYELAGDTNAAHAMYRRAHSAAQHIPPHGTAPVVPARQPIPPQVAQVAGYLYNDVQARLEMPKQLDRDLVLLDGTGSPAQTEEALRALGQYLGLIATRPDEEYGTGPDVLWDSAGGPALCLELKTDKEVGSSYTKKDLGQLRDHVQWVSEHSDSSVILPVFVGPIAPASQASNPSPEMAVIGLVEFAGVADRLRAALRDICSRAVPITLQQEVLEVFKQRGLLWPGLYAGLKMQMLKEQE
ncbi:MAG: DEAD/DEAH box helicase family protein [Pirellulaceae bacterium]